jgi:hypothetical protein
MNLDSRIRKACSIINHSQLSAFSLKKRQQLATVLPSFDDKSSTSPGGIQASFILSKPPAQLASHVTMLEEEIYQQIGVPNTKVIVLPIVVLLPPPSSNPRDILTADSQFCRFQCLCRHSRTSLT